MGIVIGERIKIVKRVQGEEFFSKSIVGARKRAEEWVNKDPTNRKLANLVDLVNYSVGFPNSSILGKAYTSDSSEDFGRTNQGSRVVIISHGSLLWTSKRIQQAYDQGLTNLCGGCLTQKEINFLLKEAISYNEYEKMSRNKIKELGSHRVVLDLADAKRIKSGEVPFSELMDAPLFIAKMGGMENAEVYLESIRVRNRFLKGKFGFYHVFSKKEFNPDENQGHLSVFGYCNSLVTDNLGDDYFGNRFLGEMVFEEQMNTFLADGSVMIRPSFGQILDLGKSYIYPEENFEKYVADVVSLFKSNKAAIELYMRESESSAF